jgi:PBSX family phage terminase large subunit
MSAQEYSRSNSPYKPIGHAIPALQSRAPELLLAGPANSGKSRCALEKLHRCATKYAGMRGLMVRKTRQSLTQTTLVTYEKRVLPEGCLGNRVKFRTSEQEYRYNNGSVLAVGGLDDDQKIMSSEYDIIYVPEATELKLSQWEALSTRLRNKVIPDYQQLIADCNPSHPKHWLKARCDQGMTKMICFTHADNPTITKADIARLKALTGVRYLRLYLGIWAAAEGLVYTEYDPAVHKVSKQQLQQWHILKADGTLNRNTVQRVICGVDWGWRNPGTLLVFAVDSLDRMYLIREVYRTGKTIDWWIAQAQMLNQFYGIEAFMADPSQPGYIQQFREAGLNAIGATNDIIPGINTMKEQLQIAPDGRPRFYVYENSLLERDEQREEDRLPVCFEDEILEYVWAEAKEGQAEKELPVKAQEHSLDAARYACVYVNGSSSGAIALVAARASSSFHTSEADALALLRAVLNDKKQQGNLVDIWDMPAAYVTEDEALRERQEGLARTLNLLSRLGGRS